MNRLRLVSICTALMLCMLGLYSKAMAQEVQDSVRIHFRQGKSLLDTSVSDNKKTFDRIESGLTVSYADSIYKLRKVTIIGGASPEGGVALNKRLSERRATVLFNYLSKYGSLPTSSKQFVYIGRDWQGLLELVKADTNVPYQAEAIALLEDIVEKTKDGEDPQSKHFERLVAFKKGVPYRYMYYNLFPKLRASRVVLYYEKVWVPSRLEGVETALSQPSFPSLTPPLRPQSLPANIFPALPVKKPFYMALKTNMLYDAALIPNLGVEFYLGARMSVAANWMYSWWKNDSANWYWRTYGGDVALRVWPGKRAKFKPLSGHHVGVYGQVLTYDFLLGGGTGVMAGEPGGNIFDRANFAAGVEYGYSLPVARRLNIDFTLGVGYMWGRYYEYKPIDDCYVWQATKNRKYFGPTKAEISLVWMIGRDNINLNKRRR